MRGQDPKARSVDMEKERTKEEVVRKGNRGIPLPGLRAARQRRGWTQRELAALAGIGSGTIASVEAGRRNAYPRTAKKLAHALETEIANLVE